MTRRFFLIIFLILFIAGCGYKKDPKNNAVSAEDASRIKRLEMQLNSSADKGLIYIELGDIYRKNKQDDSALEHYKKSIDFLSHKIPGYSKILSLYYEKKEYDKIAMWLLNLECNFRCPYCFYDDSQRSMKTRAADWVRKKVPALDPYKTRFATPEEIGKFFDETGKRW
ncbi:MAG TPA: hypothetical protein PLQ81_10710, partial [bacterium]|nr:hypothetical protein [bacterium]